MLKTVTSGTVTSHTWYLWSLLRHTLFAEGTIHKSGYCVAFGECGENPEVKTKNLDHIVPCVNNTPAIKPHQNTLDRLKTVCPVLYDGENTRLCCSDGQLEALEKSLQMSAVVLARCPSCKDNFYNIYCQYVCGSNQALFINVTRTFDALKVNHVNGTGVLEMEAYYSKRFADGAFDSCKDVRLPSVGGYAISAMCGLYGSTLCNTKHWFDFMGDISNGLAPLKIDFIFPDEHSPPIGQGMQPFDGKVWKCSESSSKDAPSCSCNDCQASCPIIPEPPLPEGEWKIRNVEGILIISAIIFCTLMLLFLLYLIGSIDWCSGDHKNLDHEINLLKELTEKDVTCSEKLSESLQNYLGIMFEKWGPLVIVLSAGISMVKLTTDPVELWSSPDSRARREKDIHDKYFGPFFRTEQVIITAKNPLNYTYSSLLFGEKVFSGILRKEILLEFLELQLLLQYMPVWSETKNQSITLKDICFAPMNPDNPTDTDCTVNSLVQYFQSKSSNLEAKVNATHMGKEGTIDWHDHFLYCINSPLSFQDTTGLQMNCMADYGAPVFPFLAVGGYEGQEYSAAEALLLTFTTRNFDPQDDHYQYALEWEKKYLEVVENFSKCSPHLNVAFMSERSLEDEINRTTAKDIPIFAISYVVIFVYIALALGEYSSCSRILVDSKITLGLGGVLVVLGAVFASMGVYAYAGVPSSLVIIEVVPFLVLAVGADNIFIFVLEYQRSSRKKGETREEHIARVLGNVAPSMLLCSLSEAVCFFLGALTKMPAVQTFALYAALAVLFDFLLQVSAFVALVSLDVQREEDNRLDICCCAKPVVPPKKKNNEGYLLPWMRKYYAPFLLHPLIRVVVFVFCFCACLVLMFHVKVGLDQQVALPKDSYMLTFINTMNKYLEVGVPTYFVTTSGYNFSTIAGMNAVCSSVGCDNNSMMQKIQFACDFSNRSYLSIPASSWVDDFIDWLNPMSSCCCNKTQLSPFNKVEKRCRQSCMKTQHDGVIRPSPDQFNKFLPRFLDDVPTQESTRFMAYHSPLVTSQEYTAALKNIRELSENITTTMRKIPGTAENFEVFPYTVTYVFYEQYLTIVKEGLFNIGVCLIPTFVVCCILLGMDILSGIINLVVILMIVIDTVGVMTLWSIDFNAVSLVNLVTAVGMSVEFISHMTRSFALSIKPSKLERAKEATAKMGSAVFAGVAMTNLPGILILGFANAQLVQIFFFRLNLVITLLGMAHGLIFLPVILSYFGKWFLLSSGILLL
uniref:NPC1 like intracellular cholesterol transporter 1 n=1 Tax=Eptatretus burgeri TaxID=7764 RepID=A0A8C4QM20_EPTBU